MQPEIEHMRSPLDSVTGRTLLATRQLGAAAAAYSDLHGPVFPDHWLQHRDGADRNAAKCIKAEARR